MVSGLETPLRFRVAVLGVLLVSQFSQVAGCGCEQCAAACNESLTVDFDTGGATPADGSYYIETLFDGRSQSCTFQIAEGDFQIAEGGGGELCSSVFYFDDPEGGPPIFQLRIQGTPAVVDLHVVRDAVEVLSQTFSPEYEAHTVCGDTCQGAAVTAALP